MSSSPRISLRQFRLSDVDEFLKWASDERVTRYLWIMKTLTSKEEALSYLEKMVLPHPWHRSICLDDSGVSIGYVSVTPDDKCRARISYAVGADYWGRGIVTTVLRVALSTVFKELPDLVRLEALVEFDNKASQKVLEKVGFIKEGLLRKYGFQKGELKDVLIYSFVSTDVIIE